jgi:CheY-like chemotaxis protein
VSWRLLPVASFVLIRTFAPVCDQDQTKGGYLVATILIADDDPDFVQIMRTILSAEGYGFVSAQNGDEALQIMRKGGVDLVLLDVMMASVLDGVGVAYAMQKDPALKAIPIIMISSIISSPHASMFPTDVYIPMDVWITKPVQPADLLEKIAGLLQKE